MKIQDFKFPELTEFDMAFSTLKTDKKLLKIAKEKGFYNGQTVYNKMFSSLFFSGGKVSFKNDVDVDFLKKAWPYCKCLMSSFEPKHEEKEAVCAMIMSEILNEM